MSDECGKQTVLSMRRRLVQDQLAVLGYVSFETSMCQCVVCCVVCYLDVVCLRWQE